MKVQSLRRWCIYWPARVNGSLATVASTDAHVRDLFRLEFFLTEDLETNDMHSYGLSTNQCQKPSILSCFTTERHKQPKRELKRKKKKITVNRTYYYSHLCGVDDLKIHVNEPIEK